MSIIVYLYRAPDAKRETHTVSDLASFLRSTFGRTFPAGGRIVDMATNQVVTPASEADEGRLRQYPGPFVVEVFPREPIQIFVAIAMTVASMMLQSALAPDPPVSTERNVRSESPNNGLSERVNQPRVNGRVPDIYGTVRSTPDLLAPSYRVFQDHVEKEVSFMCIGRGAYSIQDVRDDTTLVQEISGTSVEVYAPFTSPNSGHAPQLRIGNAIGLPVLAAKRVNSVNGQTLQPPDSGRVIRRPTVFQSPNLILSQDAGIDFTEYFLPGDVIQVSGARQTDGTFSYSVPLDAGLFDTGGSSGQEWGEMAWPGDHSGDWAAGQLVTMSNAVVRFEVLGGGDAGNNMSVSVNLAGLYPVLSVTYTPPDEFSGAEGFTTLRFDVTQNSSAWRELRSRVSPATGNPTLSRPSGVILFDLSGQYTINTVVGDKITLNDPAGSNADWTVMATQFGGQSVTLFPDLATTAERWIGWFTVRSERPIRRLIANVVALNGLYSDSGQQQYRRNVAFRLEAERLDANGVPFGGVHRFDATVIGSGTSRSTRAQTLDVVLTNTPWATWRIRARRLTATDTEFVGQTVDEIKWRDMYACGYVDQAHFGDLTTVQSVTFATDGALAVKERKLNALVTRNLPRRVSGSQFTTELYATNNVADIVAAICLDPLIGNCVPEEVDFDNVYQTAEDIRQYFGVDVAQFNYTLDKSNLSFEETLSMVAAAVFCNAYRRGSVIRLFFERPAASSTLLFNHRNKVPGSEQRTDGSDVDNDGIEYQWIDPTNDAPQTIYLPGDRSAINPRRIESVGVRLSQQAYIHAHREYNKLRYQDCATRFTALPEANLLVRSERFLSADNVGDRVDDGDLIAADGRLVSLSQPMEWKAGAAYW
ncbi:host specificity factor TipJ family phage tail protein, partial [Bordetella ansorpii]|uniref:host specificity factor TipJ family phage tail protein n=1 Tax=Bordetella ansorpii TaxID=288768 RepID=UPI00083418CA